MRKSCLFGALLVLLVACAPTTTRYLPPDTPIVYNTSYGALFSATLQELTAADIPAFGTRETFSIAEAERDTGLITAVHNERRTTATFSYRLPEDDENIPFGFGLRLFLPVAVAPPEQTVITVVVRPVGRNRASIIYSTQGPNGQSSLEAERLMREVIENLDARFSGEQSTQ
jgi:uncharacterized protein YcfL